jgi:hypothetical protein
VSCKSSFNDIGSPKNTEVLEKYGIKPRRNHSKRNGFKKQSSFHSVVEPKRSAEINQLRIAKFSVSATANKESDPDRAIKEVSEDFEEDAKEDQQLHAES